MKPFTITLFSCLMFGCAERAQAQIPGGAADAAGVQTVTITGSKSAPLWSYRSLETGIDEFDRRRATLAPRAALRFVIRDKQAEIAAGAVVKVFGDETDLTIPVAADGGFVLARNKRAYADKADVAMAVGADAAPSRKRGDFGTYPWPQVRSPDLAADTWRMGDKRLECYATVAVLIDTLPFVPRMAVKAVLLGKEFCSRSDDPKHNGSVSFPAPVPFESVTVIEGERRLVITAGANRRQLDLPLNGSWSDDALIVFKAQAADAGPTPP